MKKNGEDDKHTLSEVLGNVYLIGMAVFAVVTLLLNLKMLVSAL